MKDQMTSEKGETEPVLQEEPPVAFYSFSQSPSTESSIPISETQPQHTLNPPTETSTLKDSLKFLQKNVEEGQTSQQPFTEPAPKPQTENSPKSRLSSLEKQVMKIKINLKLVFVGLEML